jgi:hypothetical protein
MAEQHPLQTDWDLFPSFETPQIINSGSTTEAEEEQRVPGLKHSV